ncbi:hypothetical protein QBC46DRAFT_157840 [Diplogelasinospora grovesii]|uniref:LPXTG-motif cell wall anchor domain protein n=1 Tax=Diplogelasinospora grovesii TaxID=303347 RepID=A0AAN6NFQ3_9PEZI|nr:hypothetical protein QBC46DRAFT_157840 [Diplogelasinospora grovesii]
MTSSGFVSEAGDVPSDRAASYSTATAHSQNKSSVGSNNADNPNNSYSNDNSVLHVHRQNHNSSKLPAFRFADLKKDSIALPSLLQQIPPSPVSPQPAAAQNTADHPDRRLDESQRIVSSSESLHRQHHTDAQNSPKKPSSPETRQSAVVLQRSKSTAKQVSPTRNRASTYQTPSTAASFLINSPSAGSKRPASFPDSPSAAGNSNATKTQPSSSTVAPVAKRRQTDSGVTSGLETLTFSPSTLSSTRLLQAVETSSHPAENSTKEWAQGQRELLLPKTIEPTKTEEKRKSRPPVSYRPPSISSAAGGGRAVIPPIRAFRSSGSRKSLVLDMHTRRVSDDSYGEDITDPNVRDRALRALEGRGDDVFSHITPPDSADATPDNDNTADIFMRIAREDSNRGPEQNGTGEDQSAISRVVRASHRRPLSSTVPSYHPTSPPQITRRLSDQRETTRSRQLASNQSAQQMTRELAYRATTREQPASSTVATEEPGRTQSLRTPLKPSPITTRQTAFQDTTLDSALQHARRRGNSITESNTGPSTSRVTQYRTANHIAFGQNRTYNSSPLVPKFVDAPKPQEPIIQSIETNHAVEGTESSTSTAAPSTVWDELDDLKSRIHRLELTGKIPSTSGAAMSRASDERPPTANTNATTMSASPKRGSGNSATATPADASSTTSSQKEAQQQPILVSALSKTKSLISPEVFSAIEAAATDALALSSMMGAPGHPGPISSGASTIGLGGTVTDRQLRRKAEGICRSLTELCIALADEVGPTKAPPTILASCEQEPVQSPTTIKFTGMSSQRRPSTLAETSSSRAPTSPRAPTSMEQRRTILLSATPLPSPRYALAPSTPMDGPIAGRKSSLLLARTRRAGTEEPEEQSGRRSSLLLRTRRAGTEEPEENPNGRKSSLLLRSRKGIGDEEDESRFRAPSRAVTEVNGLRAAASRDYGSQQPQQQQQAPNSSQDNNPLGSSALPRRRLVVPSSTLNSRLAAPSATSTPPTTTVGGRRFLDRSTQDRGEPNSVAEKLDDDRRQRQLSLSQTAMLNRTGSLSRRTRDSAIPSLPSTQNMQTGGYR